MTAELNEIVLIKCVREEIASNRLVDSMLSRPENDCPSGMDGDELKNAVVSRFHLYVGEGSLNN